MKTLLVLALGIASALGVEVEGLPKPAAPRPVPLLQPHEKTLANGLRVIVIERPGLPLLAAQFIIQTGAEADPQKLGGLSSFTAGLLTQGTATRTASEVAQQIESLGASLTTEAGFDAVRLNLKTLSANAQPAFEIVADVVRHPKFAPDEIERARRQTLDDLRLTMEEPRTIARAVASRAVLGASPYAHPTTGTLASIPRIRRADIVAHHTRSCVPANALLIMAGAITAADGFALAEKVFGDWKVEKPAPAKPSLLAASQPRAILIDLPNAGQAAVYVAAPGLRRTADAFVTGEVANAVLGVGYSSRLNQEIRLKRGLSYGVRSQLAAWRTDGIFSAGCQTKNESAAEVVRVMQAEIQRLISEPVPADYFTSRKEVLRGDFTRDLETNEGCVERVADLALHGIPLERLNRYAPAIEAVTPADAQAFAKARLDPAAMTVIVAGRAKDCAAALREIFPKLEVIPQSKLDLDAATIGAGKGR